MVKNDDFPTNIILSRDSTGYIMLAGTGDSDSEILSKVTDLIARNPGTSYKIYGKRTFTKKERIQ